jgi:hypothetical protein
MLGAHSLFGGRTLVTIQYWRSAEELGAFARDASLSHAPAWRVQQGRGRGGGRTTAHERLESTEADYVDTSA